MAIVKVTEKGQITLPINLRRKLGITKDDYLVVESEGEYLTLHKVSRAKALSAEDPIWDMIGQGSTGKHDVAPATIITSPKVSSRDGASLSRHQRRLCSCRSQ